MDGGHGTVSGCRLSGGRDPRRSPRNQGGRRRGEPDEVLASGGMSGYRVRVWKRQAYRLRRAKEHRARLVQACQERLAKAMASSQPGLSSEAREAGREAAEAAGLAPTKEEFEKLSPTEKKWHREAEEARRSELARKQSRELDDVQPAGSWMCRWCRTERVQTLASHPQRPADVRR